MPERAIDFIRRWWDEVSRVSDPSGRVIDGMEHAAMDAAFELYHPEIEFHEDPRFPEAGVYRGADEVRRYYARFSESFDAFWWEAEDFKEVEDDRVLVLLRLRTRGKDSGVEVEARPGWIFTVRDGLVVRIDAFLDRDQAEAAAGLAR